MTKPIQLKFQPTLSGTFIDVLSGQVVCLVKHIVVSVKYNLLENIKFAHGRREFFIPDDRQRKTSAFQKYFQNFHSIYQFFRYNKLNSTLCKKHSL